MVSVGRRLPTGLFVLTGWSLGVSPELVTEHVQRNSLVLSNIVKGDDAGLEDRDRTQGNIFSSYYEENLG